MWSAEGLFPVSGGQETVYFLQNTPRSAFTDEVNYKVTIMPKIPFDKIINTIAGLGVPGLVLLVAMALSGWAGAAALTTALAALGGPLGMLGGVGLLALISWAIAEYGFEKIAVAVIKELKRRGRNRQGVLTEINGYPISRGMKLKILDAVNKAWLA